MSTGIWKPEEEEEIGRAILGWLVLAVTAYVVFAVYLVVR